jgi:REP element-mobilizing transposase RayT
MNDQGRAGAPKIYQGFGRRPFHQIPAWVRSDAIFHVRVRVDTGSRSLIEKGLATELLSAVRLYHERRRWCVHLFLLMPDHWHALLSFPAAESMSRAIGDWKRYQARRHGIAWQPGYFDHRLRAHLDQLEEKAAYIRRNPVVAGLCLAEQEWPWQWAAPDIAPDTRPESSRG